jgi:ABC-type cobalt transport system substrate-binding protein
MIIIVVGMLYIGWKMSGYVCGVDNVVSQHLQDVEPTRSPWLRLSPRWCSGLCWKRANAQGAMFSIALNVTS